VLSLGIGGNIGFSALPQRFECRVSFRVAGGRGSEARSSRSGVRAYSVAFCLMGGANGSALALLLYLRFPNPARSVFLFGGELSGIVAVEPDRSPV
jgi:hypothetical protein